MTRIVLSVALLLQMTQVSFSQKVEVIKYPELLKMMAEDKTTEIVIYNFWATWCAPCIKEMPHFEKVNAYENVAVNFISLDDANKLEDRVIPFLERKHIQSKVFLLDETDYNEFIDKIDGRWSGAIPATVIYNNSTREKLFFEKEFSEEELETIIRNQLN